MSDQTPSYVVPQGSSQDKQRITVGGGGAAWHSQQRQQHQTQTNFHVGQQQQPKYFPNSNAQSPRAGESMVTGPLPGASGYAQGVIQRPVSSGGSSQGSSVTAMQVQAASQSSEKAPAIVVVQGKSRTTCNFCMLRKKRCDYEEINGQKQPCSLCKSKQRKCVFEMKPPRAGKKTPSGGGNANGLSHPGSSPSAKKKSTALTLKRARMAPSMATGLVGLEENIFVADFFDRLGFFPVANERNVQRAIMELLFKPAYEASAGEGRRPGAPKQESALALRAGGGERAGMEDIIGRSAAIHQRWQKKEGEEGKSKAFACALWCSVALGALTGNMSLKLVKRYVRLAEEAIDGLWNPDVPTAKAYCIMAMMYAWMDKTVLFGRHLKSAQRLVQMIQNDPNGEEVPEDLKDMLMELDRVLALHYSDDMAVIRRCCYSDNGVPPTMGFAICGSGLFHMARYYTDGVFKAFWRDVDKRDPLLTETKKFSEEHLGHCLEIERIATTKVGMKETAGGLYIRAAMQFMRLPFKNNPADTLRSSIELSNVICNVPGMIRFGPLKHYVHCLVMGLSRPAIAGLDAGAYERLRTIYNSLDIPGPNIVGAENMDIATLCKHPFCRGMAWFHQQKAIRQQKEAEAMAEAAAESAVAASIAANSGDSGMGGGGVPAATDIGRNATVDTSGIMPEGIGQRGSGGGSGGGGVQMQFDRATSPNLASVPVGGGMGGGRDSFPQAPASAAAAAAVAATSPGATGVVYPNPAYSSPQTAAFRVDGGAAPFDGIHIGGAFGGRVGGGGGEGAAAEALTLPLAS